jgi:hypothetical protein
MAQGRLTTFWYIKPARATKHKAGIKLDLGGFLRQTSMVCRFISLFLTLDSLVKYKSEYKHKHAGTADNPGFLHSLRSAAPPSFQISFCDGTQIISPILTYSAEIAIAVAASVFSCCVWYYLLLNGPEILIRSVRVRPFSVILARVKTVPSFPTAIELTYAGL